jgi:hypothetical protein
MNDRGVGQWDRFYGGVAGGGGSSGRYGYMGMEWYNRYEREREKENKDMTMVLIYVLIPLVFIGLAVGMFWMVIREYSNVLDVVDDIRKRGREYKIEGNEAIEVKKEGKSVWSPELQERIDVTDKMGKDLAELVKMMQEKREMERIRESDRSLVEEAEALRNKNRKPQPVMSSLIGRGEDRQVSTNAKVLIPYGLSELDKEILEEFYNK